jgi:hypothetical protein
MQRASQPGLKDHDAYQKVLDRLLRDLRVGKS